MSRHVLKGSNGWLLIVLFDCWLCLTPSISQALTLVVTYYRIKSASLHNFRSDQEPNSMKIRPDLLILYKWAHES